MTTQELRVTIHHLINKTDDPEILQSIYVLLKNLLSGELDNDIVGYEADGAPITSEAFLRSILKADEDIERGNAISFQAMKAKYGVQ